MGIQGLTLQDVQNPPSLITWVPHPCHLSCTISSLATLFPVGRSGRQEAERRTGLSSLVSGYVGSDMDESAGLVWDTAAFSWGQTWSLECLLSYVLLSLHHQDVSTVKAKGKTCEAWVTRPPPPPPLGDTRISAPSAKHVEPGAHLNGVRASGGESLKRREGFTGKSVSMQHSPACFLDAAATA